MRRKEPVPAPFSDLWKTRERLSPRDGGLDKADSKRGRPPDENDPRDLTPLADQPRRNNDGNDEPINIDVARHHNDVVWHNLTRSKSEGMHNHPLHQRLSPVLAHWALSFLHPLRGPILRRYAGNSLPRPSVGVDRQEQAMRRVLASCWRRLFPHTGRQLSALDFAFVTRAAMITVEPK